MLDDINDIIAKHLPAQVGEVLRKRLTEAAAADKKIVEQGNTIRDLREEVNALKKENDEAKKILLREQGLLTDEAKMRTRQIALEKDEAVLKARAEMTQQILDNNKEIVLAVFANNRMKYHESTQVPFAFATPPSPGNAYPCPQSTTMAGSKTAEIQG